MNGKLYRGAGIGLLAAVVALVLSEIGALQRFEDASWSWRQRTFSGPGEHSADIRLVLLDQPSLDWGSRQHALSWPWPREMYAAAVDELVACGARVIAIDVLFLEPSAAGVADDEAFGAALRRSGRAVGAIYPGDGTFRQWPAWIPEPSLRGAAADLVAASQASFPVRDLAGMASVGSVAAAPDEDGINRRVPLLQVFDGRLVPSLGLATWMVGEQRPGGEVTHRGRCWQLPGGTQLPANVQAHALLRYRGDAELYRPVALAAVVESHLRRLEGKEPSLPADAFQDAWVLLGFSAPGLMDLRPTPISPKAPGVLVHATLLDNLLSGELLRPLPHGWSVFLTFLFSALAALATVTARRARQAALQVVLALAMITAIGLYSFRLGLAWPMMAHGLGVVLAMGGCVVYLYATEGQQKAFIKRAFRQYLSPLVIDRLLENPSQLKLGGERKTLTLFFSDLQGFSTFAEKLDPEALTGLLNEYLSEMSAILLAEGATVDKYEGDAIIAFWNAPLDQPDHALRACRAALRCRDRLAEVRPDFLQRYGAELHMRIGLHTGDVVVGNMGSADRFDYTVLGDAANLASRLEGANKPFGTEIMVSEVTWRACAGGVQGRELARLTVVGRSAPLTVFELLALAGETSTRHALDAILTPLRAGQLVQAREAAEERPDDTAAAAYAHRLGVVLERGETWDGVWHLESK